MARHYFSSPEVARITQNLSRAVLGSAQDDRSIAGARYDTARAVREEGQNADLSTLGKANQWFQRQQKGVNPNIDFHFQNCILNEFIYNIYTHLFWYYLIIFDK